MRALLKSDRSSAVTVLDITVKNRESLYALDTSEISTELNGSQQSIQFRFAFPESQKMALLEFTIDMRSFIQDTMLPRQLVIDLGQFISYCVLWISYSFSYQSCCSLASDR